MSWNPFSRHSAPKKNVVSRASEREFEREVKKLEELDEATRKLYKDAKRFVEANNALAKVEHKLVQDLQGSGLCQQEEDLRGNVEEWDRSLETLDRHRQELNTNIQRAVIEPMKKFSGVFPSVQAAMKKREQSLQDYSRCQAKVDKYQERDRTGTNVVKLEYNKRALDSAKEEFQHQNEAMKQDLPRLYDGRIEYFQPSLEALARSQVENDDLRQHWIRDYYKKTGDVITLYGKYHMPVSTVLDLQVAILKYYMRQVRFEHDRHRITGSASSGLRLVYLVDALEALFTGRFEPNLMGYYSEAFNTYSAVSSDLFRHSKMTEQERRARINQTLTDIRGLSITVDD